MTRKQTTIIKKKAVIDALKKTLGIVTPACEMAGISRETFYKWKKEDPIFRAAVEDMDDVTLDFVESQLMKNIREGSEKAIMFFMRYKAKKRGYSDEINMNIRMEQPLLKPLDDEDEQKNLDEWNDDDKGDRLKEKDLLKITGSAAEGLFNDDEWEDDDEDEDDE
jgi:hypothetical protein